MGSPKRVVHTRVTKLRCERAPMGAYGLEGYQIGETYDAKVLEFADGSSSWVVYPDHEDDVYCESMSVSSKNKFFTETNNNKE